MVKFSDDVTQGVEKSAARAMLRAVGLEDEDFNKFQDAVNGTLDHVKKELLPDVDFSEFDREYENRSDSEE